MRRPLEFARDYVPTRADLPSASSFKPHRPAPFGELSWPRRVRRVGGLLTLASVAAMVVSAATASTDWNVTGDGPP